MHDAFFLFTKSISLNNEAHEKNDTLNREPIEENLEDLDVSSGSGGKRPATNGHLEALNKS